MVGLIDEVRTPATAGWSPGPVSARPIGWDPDRHRVDPRGSGDLQPLLFTVDPAVSDQVPDADPALEPVGTIHPDRVRDVARVVVEVLTARRPVAQITGWVTPPVLGRITATRSVVATTPERDRPVPARVASLHSTVVNHDVLEVAVRVIVGDRSVAMAFQLRRRGRRWICTAWEHRPEDLVGPTAAHR